MGFKHIEHKVEHEVQRRLAALAAPRSPDGRGNAAGALPPWSPPPDNTSTAWASPTVPVPAPAPFSMLRSDSLGPIPPLKRLASTTSDDPDMDGLLGSFPLGDGSS